ncbi:MAG: hypothetical protein WKG00_16690 [Polyangiaceae bacterium]
MQVPRHAFREYDVRAVAERDLSDELVEAIGRTFVATLRAERSVPSSASPSSATGA